MHVATDIKRSMFTTLRAGQQAQLEAVFPDWRAEDRLGIVIREPFGSLGGSLLLQVAALLHYEVRPERRNEQPQYPQLYTFHVGEPWGDHSSFDVWPPRREVMVGASPTDLLGEINDRAITRLLIPDVQAHSAKFVDEAPSGWTDQAVFLENVTSAWAYGANGRVRGADLVVTSGADELERMATWALTPEDTFEFYQALTGEELVDEMKIGPSSATDLLQWRETLRGRITEVPMVLRNNMLRVRNETGMPRSQEFRSLSASDALQRL